MPRSTKIVATLGPASSDSTVLERMLRAGVDVVRLNFSHGSAADHEQRAARVTSTAAKTGRTVAIMCDLQGPTRIFGPCRSHMMATVRPAGAEDPRRQVQGR